MSKKSVLLISLVVFIASMPLFVLKNDNVKAVEENKKEISSPQGVCPPFELKDENGNIINPVKGINSNTPYSPKQTCGECHDYDLITEGYHFTQGKGEKLPECFAERYNWGIVSWELWG